MKDARSRKFWSLFVERRQSLWLLMLIAGFGCGADGLNKVASSGSDQVVEKSAEKGPVKVTVRATPRAPRLSDLVEFDVIVTAPKGVDIKPPAFGQAVGDFLVRDYSEKSDPGVAASASDVVRRFHYQLEPAETGRHLIRSQSIEFVDRRPLSEQKDVTSFVECEPLEIDVTSEMGDQIPDLAKLEPMEPPQPLDQSSSNWWWGLGGLMAVAAWVVYWRRRRKANQERQVPSLTPAQIAHAALTALLAENLPAQGLFKEFYLRLTGIVRQYIEGTTGLRAPEQTTEEFLQAMREKEVFPYEKSIRLKEFLEAADMVKYAGQRPDEAQLSLSNARAREFVSYQVSSPNSEESGKDVTSATSLTRN